MNVRKYDIPKLVEVGDVVLLNGKGKRRLVCSVDRRHITFVRLGTSWCWEGAERNATAVYSLPNSVTIVQKATDETRLLAERFESWKLIPVPDKAWEQVCRLEIGAIKCCED